MCPGALCAYTRARNELNTTSVITRACSGSPDTCPGPDSDHPADSSYICIPASSFSSFTASQVFGAFAICLQLLLTFLMVLKKVQARGFAACSWATILCLIIAVCCAVLGLRQIENCEDGKLQQIDPSFTITYTTSLLPAPNAIIAAIFFEFFIWACVRPPHAHIFTCAYTRTHISYIYIQYTHAYAHALPTHFL